MRDGHIVIVGAGEAGVAAAVALREGGHVGRLTLLNDEGVTPYERPPLSKDMIVAPGAPPKPIRDASWYDAHRVDLRSAALASVDADARLARLVAPGGGEEDVAFDTLLFATGATVRRLPHLGDDVAYLRTLADGAALGDRVAAADDIVIVGGGVIGLEVASSARSLGKRVVVLDMAARLMGRALAPAISDRLLALHRANGVEVVLNVASLRRDGADLVVDNKRRFRADLVLAGVGVVPNTLLAERAGCAVDNGIIVDRCGRTSVPGIYAAGDVAAFPHAAYDRVVRIESWQHAGRHGAHVGRAMIGIEDDYREVPWFWTDQFGVNIQVAGLTDAADRTVWRGDAARGTAFHFAGDRLVAATTIDNGRDMRPAIRLIDAGWQGAADVLTDPARPLGKIATDLLAAGGD